MTVYFSQPAPTLTINDETGEWVMTRNVTRVIPKDRSNVNSGSLVYLVQEGSDQKSYAISPLSPEELQKRLFCTDLP